MLCNRLIIAVIASVVPTVSIASQDDFELSLVVRDKVLMQIPKAQASFRLIKHAAVQELNHKANFNVIQIQDSGEYGSLDSGLIGTRGKNSTRTSQGVSTGVSLCGLIPLVTESISSTENTITTVAPIGKMFVPFGIKSTSDFNFRSRLVDFESSVASVCAVSEGQAFSYRVEIETNVKTSGVFGRTISGKRKEEASCTVGNSFSSGKQILPTLTSDYLEVSCHVSALNGAKRQSKYAFLQDSKTYLLLEQTDDWSTTKVKFSELEFAAVPKSGDGSPPPSTPR